MPSYIAHWRAISRQAAIRGDDVVAGVGYSSPFSSYTDAERWLDAKLKDYRTDPRHIAEGISCNGWIETADVPALIIRHCDEVLVLSGERCPKCGIAVGVT